MMLSSKVILGILLLVQQSIMAVDYQDPDIEETSGNYEDADSFEEDHEDPVALAEERSFLKADSSEIFYSDNDHADYVDANDRIGSFRGSNLIVADSTLGDISTEISHGVDFSLGNNHQQDYQKEDEGDNYIEQDELFSEGFDIDDAGTNFYLAEENAIKDEWNVVMKKIEGVSTFTVEAAETFAHEIAKMTGSSIEILSVYTTAIQGFTVRGMTQKAAKKFTKDKRVEFVEQNAKVKLDTAVTWGIDRIDQRNLPMDNGYAPINNRDGSGVTAYIIDTGIRITHDDFEGESGRRSRARWGTNTADNENDDCNGHGTHVAGTVGGKKYGVAKNVNLVAVKVLNCRGSGTYAGVIAGVEWTMRDARGKKATANLSLGGGGSRAMDNAVRNLHNSGVPTVVAAGNFNRNACSYSPAREPSVITVGATKSNDHRAAFSNYGSCLDIFAPGQSIMSAWSSGDSDYRAMSGTSMASPHACGAVVLHLQDGSLAGAVKSVITAAATTSKVINAGTGSPNLLLYVGGERLTCERPWTSWYDRDNPSGTGDWEPMSLANPTPCSGEAPLDIKCQTTRGLDAASTGEVITCDPSFGFKCVNRDQPDGRCNYDYKVSYRCCGPACERTWTNWYDRDDPGGTGDWEPTSLANPKPCGGERPIDIECQTTRGHDAASTGEVITCNPNYGFKCANRDQPDGRCNYDYKVRYRCCEGLCKRRTWTNWYDRDDPSGTGDWEPMSLVNPKPCGGKTPVGIECQTTSGLAAASTREVITCDPNYGFRCVNSDQPDGRCNYDYKVRYLCCANN